MAGMMTGGNDRVYTPDELAVRVIRDLPEVPSGRVLEPCVGGGAFVRALRAIGVEPIQLEIDHGTDFFEFHERVDWVITNPPWSKSRMFLRHAYDVSDRVVFLINLVHVIGLRARLRDMSAAGFGLKFIHLYENPPKPWPQFGFQLASVYMQRSYSGPITLRDVR